MLRPQIAGVPGKNPLQAKVSLASRATNGPSDVASKDVRKKALARMVHLIDKEGLAEDSDELDTEIKPVWTSHKTDELIRRKPTFLDEYLNASGTLDLEAT